MLFFKKYGLIVAIVLIFVAIAIIAVGEGRYAGALSIGDPELIESERRTRQRLTGIGFVIMVLAVAALLPGGQLQESLMHLSTKIKK